MPIRARENHADIMQGFAALAETARLCLKRSHYIVNVFERRPLAVYNLDMHG